ncbi:MAG: universal stress protein [Flavobacteriales bacterium]|nr:universal stress protein [Flavobacteriales bacterium]MCB9198284.1 universal stress protein [Flavobacteriales bacterium]
MKKILVPTDFSGAADSAVKFALKISENFNSEVVLLNSFEVPHSGATMMVSINDLLQEESVKGLERLSSRIGEDYPSTKIKTVSLQGNLENCVEEVIKSHQIDLVVMGTTGATGIEGKLFGSNTANMIRNISAPLIVLPENADIDLPKSIAITTDFKFEVDDAIYNPVREFALGYSSKVNFINVTTSYQEADLQVIEDKFGMDVDFVYNENVEAGIKEYLEQKKVDLLVVVAEKHSIFHNIFKPSHSKMMARELNIPMMILAQ